MARLLYASGRELPRMRIENPAEATEERLIALVEHQMGLRLVALD